VNERTRILPIGVDLGTTRVRLVAAETDRAGRTKIAAAVARDLPDGALVENAIVEPDLVATVLEEAFRELGFRQRRCAMSLPCSAAAIRLMRLPGMGWTERKRCARFEAERFSPWDASEIPSIVRVRALDARARVHAIGIARTDAVAARTVCAKKAGLRLASIDHDACALARAFPYADAVLDVGYLQTTLHAVTPSAVLSEPIPLGGSHVTRAIAIDLAIDGDAAEKRKRILGTAGAGDGAVQDLAAQVGVHVGRLRNLTPIRRVALTGNGARLPGLAEAIAAAAGVVAELQVSDVLRDGAYPNDVVRSAAPDWTLAAALATGSAA